MNNVYDHLKSLSLFLLKDDNDNVNLYNNIIYFFPEEINIIILKRFIESTVKSSGCILDKREIRMFSDKNFRRFNRCLSNSAGRLLISNHLEIVGRSFFNSYFHESYYDLVDILSHQIGFTPTKEYVSKLLKIFPDHKFFLILKLSLNYF